MKVVGFFVLASLIFNSATAATRDIELLRPANVGASAPALAIVKKALAAKDFTLKDVVVNGGGEDAVAAALADGKPPPAAAWLNGYEVRALADERKLGDVSVNAERDRWASYLTAQARTYLMSQGRWVAAPLDVMPLNGIWINAALLQRIGGAAPDTIESLFSLLDRARAAGIAPLTVAGSPRELALLFEQVVIATAGPSIYKRVFIDENEMAIQSDKMIRAFEAFARLRAYVAVEDASLDAQAAAQRVVRGDALAFAGPGSTDLLFKAAGKVADKDYLCLRFPGTSSTILYQMDIVAMLKASPDAWPAQSALADVVMDPQVQTDVGLATGAVPARGDADTSKFDACGSHDVADLQVATALGSILGSTAYGFTQSPAITAAYVDVVARFFHGEIPTAEAATAALHGVLTASH